MGDDGNEEHERRQEAGGQKQAANNGARGNRLSPSLPSLHLHTRNVHAAKEGSSHTSHRTRTLAKQSIQSLPRPNLSSFSLFESLILRS